MTNRPQRILVVDDDVDACQNLRDILADLDYSVDLAHSGEAAVLLVQRQPYDVALIDLRMPGMDGIAFSRQLRRLRPETVAILITAYASRETEDNATQEGAWHVLAKPVDVSRLLPLIEDAVQQPLLLIVDDDTDLCHSLWDLLRERGFRVSLAGSGAEATARLQDRDFCVVLVDLRLPDTDGTVVMATILAKSPLARIVLMTGYRDELQGFVDQALGHADAVCFKPLDVPRLLEDLQRLARPQ